MRGRAHAGRVHGDVDAWLRDGVVNLAVRRGADVDLGVWVEKDWWVGRDWGVGERGGRAIGRAHSIVAANGRGEQADGENIWEIGMADGNKLRRVGLLERTRITHLVCVGKRFIRRA